MIVIEGAGQLGKTTAANRLVELAMSRGIVAEYRHMTRPDEGFNFGSHYFPMIEPSLVRDRFHLGGLVWHDHRHTGLTSERVQIIQAKIHAIGGMVIVFHATNYDWFRQQWSIRGGKGEVACTQKLGVQQAANVYYSDTLSDSGWCDRDYDISETGFLDDAALQDILSEWIERRRFAGTL